jgi:hypothetical protein
MGRRLVALRAETGRSQRGGFRTVRISRRNPGELVRRALPGWQRL